MFLDVFMDLLKYESRIKSNNNSIINEQILLMLLLNSVNNFDDITILVPYLKDGLFTKIISLKYNKNDANINFYENKFKYFVTINECFNQFIKKIFTEEKMFQNLIEGVFKYAWANVKTEDNEIYVEDFMDLCSEFCKDNEKIFEKALLNLFDIVEIENANSKDLEKDKNKNNSSISKKVKYAFRLKPIYEKSIQNIKNELKILENKDKEKDKEKGKEKKDKDKDKEEDNNEIDTKNKDTSQNIKTDKNKHKSLSQQPPKKKEVIPIQKTHKKSLDQKTQNINTKKKIEEQMEQISQLFSETNKSIFHLLLKHIWGATAKIEKDIEKNEIFQIFARNYIIDLDTSLIALSNILYCFPSYLSLLGRFHNGKRHKINFFNFLIKNIIPALNYFHYYVVLPPHVNNNEELIEIFSKEKNDTLRKYGYKANSYMSFMESFRYINIIISLIQSLTYKKRNMNDDEIFLLNKCRKKLLF